MEKVLPRAGLGDADPWDAVVALPMTVPILAHLTATVFIYALAWADMTRYSVHNTRDSASIHVLANAMVLHMRNPQAGGGIIYVHKLFACDASDPLSLSVGQFTEILKAPACPHIRKLLDDSLEAAEQFIRTGWVPRESACDFSVQCYALGMSYVLACEPDFEQRVAEAEDRDTLETETMHVNEACNCSRCEAVMQSRVLFDEWKADAAALSDPAVLRLHTMLLKFYALPVETCALALVAEVLDSDSDNDDGDNDDDDEQDDSDDGDYGEGDSDSSSADATDRDSTMDVK
jgi:hypothetical protein